MLILISTVRDCQGCRSKWVPYFLDAFCCEIFCWLLYMDVVVCGHAVQCYTWKKHAWIILNCCCSGGVHRHGPDSPSLPMILMVGGNTDRRKSWILNFPGNHYFPYFPFFFFCNNFYLSSVGKMFSDSTCMIYT